MQLNFFRNLFLIFLGFISLFNCALAQNILYSPQVKEFVQQTSEKYKIDPNYIWSILRHAKYTHLIVKKEHQRNQEKILWSDYAGYFLKPDLIEEGAQFWQRNRKLLAWEEKEYGVPPEIIIGILGIETRYGKAMGNYRVLDSLFSLAFSDVPKAEYFRSELAAFIALTRTYHMNPLMVHGAFDGGLGMCQFMPSSYLYYGVDFHGKHRPDLFADPADVIFSIGNFLRQKGWEVDQPIVMSARVKGRSYQEIAKLEQKIPLKPQFKITDLEEKYDVYPLGTVNPNLHANLLVLANRDQTNNYWLIFNNFYVITRYNNSNFYAMTAYELGKHVQALVAKQDLEKAKAKAEKEKAKQEKLKAKEKKAALKKQQNHKQI